MTGKECEGRHVNCVTLLTDFGLEDEYVGVMKGVILTIHPTAAIIDISHNISPQNISSAARMLQAACPYFPKNTVHVCVVDPGVGTDRAVIAARLNDHVYIAPDNGILFPILQKTTVQEIVRVENPDFFLPSVSHTFHGRDIFAPAAAHILEGVAITALGSAIPVDQLVPLHLSEPRIAPDGSLVGTIIGADRFGNLLTDITSGHIDLAAESTPSLEIHVGGATIRGLSRSYGPADGKTCLAIMGSRGCLEIAVSGGSALRRLNANTGDPVSILRNKSAKQVEQNP